MNGTARKPRPEDPRHNPHPEPEKGAVHSPAPAKAVEQQDDEEVDLWENLPV